MARTRSSRSALVSASASEAGDGAFIGLPLKTRVDVDQRDAGCADVGAKLIQIIGLGDRRAL